MKCPFYISILLCGAIWFASCTGPVILEEKAESGSQTSQEDTPTPQDTVAIIHEGTYASPYSIAEAQTLGHGKSVWVEGYIVGCVSGSMKSGCNFTAETDISSNILLADTFPTGDENDYLRCLPIDLTSSSARDELNLRYNPQNFHRKIRLQGTTKEYFKVTGLKDTDTYVFCDEITPESPEEPEEDTPNEGGNNDDNPNKPHDPNATRQDTLSIAEAIALQNQGEQPYIRGYIIGYFNGSSMVFNPTEEQITSRANSNVLLADNIEETDWRNVIIVELPTKTALRSKVNLNDNPENLHHRLTVKGMLGDYKETSYAGCMNTLSKFGDNESYYFLLE